MRGHTVSDPPLCAEGDWIAVQVRLNRERVVGRALAERGYEQLVPVVRIPATRSRRTHERVLVPGYVFCRYTPRPVHRIVQAPGVLRLVGTAGRPLAIPDTEVDALLRIAESGVYAEPWRFVTSGDRVQVNEGPLVGLEGIVLYLKNEVRVVVSVTMLQRSVAVDLDLQSIRPLAPRLHASPAA